MKVLKVLEYDQLHKDPVNTVKNFILLGYDFIGIELASISKIRTTYTNVYNLVYELNKHLIQVKQAIDLINLNSNISIFYNPIKIVVLLPNMFSGQEKMALSFYDYVFRNTLPTTNIFIVEHIKSVKEMQLISKANTSGFQHKVFYSLDNTGEIFERQDGLLELSDTLSINGIEYVLFGKHKNFFEGKTITNVYNIFNRRNIHFGLHCVLNDQEFSKIYDQLDKLSMLMVKPEIMDRSRNKKNRARINNTVLIRYWENIHNGCKYLYSTDNKNIYTLIREHNDFERILESYLKIEKHDILPKIVQIHETSAGRIIEYEHSGKSLRWLFIRKFFTIQEEHELVEKACLSHLKLNSLNYKHGSASLDNLLMQPFSSGKIKIVFLDYLARLHPHSRSYDLERLLLDICCIYIYRDGYIPKRTLQYSRRISIFFDKIYHLCFTKERQIKEKYQSYDKKDSSCSLDSFIDGIFRKLVTQFEQP
mmetsp:Transcript_4361/g.9867  ORF Transcript_4361/g.9867 Transcript_4361/m.9867 type:complete len:478 (-) Transcript_4361:4428-5861(-)